MHRTSSRRGRVRRALLATVGAVGTALLLSGCLKLDMDMTVNSDDTIDGTVVFAVDKSLLTLGGGNPEDAFQDDVLGDAPFPTTAPGGGSVSTEVYDQDGKYGQRYTFSGVPLTEFDDEDLSIRREGDYVVVSGTMDMSDTGSSDEQSGGSESPIPFPTELMTAGFDVSISVTFPGEVVESNGTIDGTTVTWTPKVGESTSMSAKARATSSPAALVSSPGFLVGVGVLALLLLGGLVALLVRGSRRREPEAPAVDGVPASVPAAGVAADAVVPGFPDTAAYPVPTDTAPYPAAPVPPPPTAPPAAPPTLPDAPAVDVTAPDRHPPA